MTTPDQELLDWELEDDYLRQNCEPSYLTHPLWLAHQAKKPIARDAVATEATAARADLSLRARSAARRD